jgi:hypothetical protein
MDQSLHLSVSHSFRKKKNDYLVDQERSKMASKVDMDALFDGVIEPSDQAYVDTFLDEAEIDIANVSVRSYEEQSYSKDLKTHVTRFNHEVSYNGDLIWRVEIDSRYACDKKTRFSSSCKLSQGKLGIFLQTEGDKKDNRYWSEKKDKIEKRFLDVASLIRASAAAYQLYAAEEEVGIQYEILNQGSQGEESLNLYISESFSSYLFQTSNGGDDDEEGSEDDREANDDRGERGGEDMVIRDATYDDEDERSRNSGVSDGSEESSQASSHASSHTSGVSSFSAKNSKDKPRRQTSIEEEIPTNSWGFFDMMSFLG